jgi:hypothetical protein
MTRRCEIDKIGVDLPCMRRASHFLKIMSKRIGDRGKFKIWLCDKHHKIIQDRATLTNFLESIHEAESLDKTSDRFTASVSR